MIYSSTLANIGQSLVYSESTVVMDISRCGACKTKGGPQRHGQKVMDISRRGACKTVN